jgi:hypothetical protein
MELKGHKELKESILAHKEVKGLRGHKEVKGHKDPLLDHKVHRVLRDLQEPQVL